MIKRLLATLFPIVFMPYMIFAISLDTIQKNPSQYKKICETVAGTIYIEPKSIHSLRYSPPYYTLKAKCYSISYSAENIIECNIVFDYDNNYSLASTTARIDSFYRNYSKKEKLQLLARFLHKNSGMTYALTEVHSWRLDGSAIGMHHPRFGLKCIYGGVFYKVGLYMFSKYYDRPFGIAL